MTTKDAPRTYLLVDTNNFIECFEVGYKDVSNNMESLLTPQQLMSDDKLRLLLPEIVGLEVGRLIQVKRQELDAAYADARAKVGTIVDNSDVLDSIDRILVAQQGQFAEYEAVWHTLLAHKNTIKVQLNDTIFLNAYKRGLAGARPFKKANGGIAKFMHNIQPDCVIVESAKYFLDQVEYEKLYICSKDPDYLEEGALHSDILADFSPAEYQRTLVELLTTHFGSKITKTKAAPIKAEALDHDSASANDPQSLMQLIVRDLEQSGTFDGARSNIIKVFRNKETIDGYWLQKLLEAILLNPESYPVNQVLAVDNEMAFSKRLYVYLPGYQSVWLQFAKNLIITLNDDAKLLSKYNWLFKELNMPQYDPNHINLDDIPF